MFNIFRGNRLSLIAAAFSILLPSAAQATVVTISTSLNQLQQGADNQGWWSNTTQNNNPVNDNYYTGSSGEFFDAFRSFFSFDLSGLSGTVISARFDVRRYDQSGEVNLSLWDVSTPAIDLLTTRTNILNNAIFTDLGSGINYGSFNVVGGASLDVLQFTLNSAALADINSMLGSGYFSLGASVQGSGYIFGASLDEPGNSFGDFNSVQNLVLNIQPSNNVSEPTALGLLGLGFLGLSVARRLRY